MASRIEIRLALTRATRKKASLRRRGADVSDINIPSLSEAMELSRYQKDKLVKTWSAWSRERTSVLKYGETISTKRLQKVAGKVKARNNAMARAEKTIAALPKPKTRQKKNPDFSDFEPAMTSQPLTVRMVEAREKALDNIGKFDLHVQTGRLRDRAVSMAESMGENELADLLAKATDNKLNALFYHSDFFKQVGLYYEQQAAKFDSGREKPGYVVMGYRETIADYVAELS